MKEEIVKVLEEQGFRCQLSSWDRTDHSREFVVFAYPSSTYEKVITDQDVWRAEIFGSKFCITHFKLERRTSKMVWLDFSANTPPEDIFPDEPDEYMDCELLFKGVVSSEQDVKDVLRMVMI